MNTLDIKPLLQPVGLAQAAMTPPQRGLLVKLLDAYAGLMADDIAADRMAKIRSAGLDRVAFAWAGGLSAAQKHYYRVQGPTFLIEFDNTQDDGNHVHAVWRISRGTSGGTCCASTSAGTTPASPLHARGTSARVNALPKDLR